MFLGIVVLGLLLSSNAYAFLIKSGEESLPIITVPPGAQCELRNNKGVWSVVTPGEVIVKRSKQPLKITCVKNGYKKITKSYHLKDPKKFKFNDVSQDTLFLVTDAAVGDIFGVVLDVTGIVLSVVNNKFGTYATNKRNGKGYIFIKLFTGIDPDFIEDDK